MSASPAVRSIARHRGYFWLHAALLVLLAILLSALPWLMRNMRIVAFVGIFVVLVTGFIVWICGLVDAGAALEANLDKEAMAWLVALLVAAAIFLGIVLVLFPTLSVQRLCFFASLHALAMGFLEVRLAQRLRVYKHTYKQITERLRGFAAVSTTFFLLLLMPVIYGERFAIFVLAVYCLFFALELVLLPMYLRVPQSIHAVETS